MDTNKGRRVARHQHPKRHIAASAMANLEIACYEARAALDDLAEAPPQMWAADRVAVAMARAEIQAAERTASLMMSKLAPDDMDDIAATPLPAGRQVQSE